MSQSEIEKIAREAASKGVDPFAHLTAAEALTIRFDWSKWARPEQLAPPGDWTWWLLCAGRAFGKTRSAAEWVRAKARLRPGSRGILIGATPAEVRNVMIEGESGLLAVHPDEERPTWTPSVGSGGVLTWPNGTSAVVLSAHHPESIRGAQGEWLWLDELAKWKYSREAFDQVSLALRLGPHVQGVVSTTPRPVAVMRELLANPACVTVKGSTYDNAGNLAPNFMRELVAKYEGSRLGRQELHAELLDDTPGALFQRAWFDSRRVVEAPAMDLVVVGIDPAVSNTDESDETGIVAAGRTEGGEFFTLRDRSLRGSPHEWASAAVRCFHEVGANHFVVEKNQGGDMVAATVRHVWPEAPIREVSASRGKATRAEPIATLYEQGRVHHVGAFDTLEDQACAFVPGESTKSPDRMDALVWALTELSQGRRVFIV